MFDQMISKFMKANPTDLNIAFLEKYGNSNKSRSYLIMGMGFIKKSDSQEFINMFKLSIKNQIAQRRAKIATSAKYTVGIRYLLNLEFDYVEKALPVFFDEMDYGRAIEMVYINERDPKALAIKTRS